jgi:hypothetical protein
VGHPEGAAVSSPARHIALAAVMLVWPVSGCVLGLESKQSEPSVSDVPVVTRGPGFQPAGVAKGTGWQAASLSHATERLAFAGPVLNVPQVAGETGGVDPTPLFRDWPTPDAVIVFSGQQHGRTKPCGCSPLFQKGGLARRQGFLDQVRQKQWPMLLADLGGMADDLSEQPVQDKYLITQEQSQLKLKITLEALEKMGYDVMGLGPEDVAGGFIHLIGLMLGMQRPHGLNANLSIKPEFVEEGWFQPHVVREVGRVRIGLTAAVTERFKDRMTDPELNWQDPRNVLPATLDKLKRESDLQVLLLYGYLEDSQQLAQRLPEFDVIIHGSKFDEPTGRPEWTGQTMLVTVGTQGKYVGAIGVYRNRRPTARFELVELDDRFEEDAEIHKLVNDDYLDRLAPLNLVQNAGKLFADAVQPDLAYVGSERCKECHPNVYKKWSSTRHADALQTLIEGAHGKGKGTHVDPECISCHTVGFMYKTGYDGTSLTKHLGGNGCENCHGPGNKHVEVMAKIKAGEDVDAKLEEAVLKMVHAPRPTREKNICSRCHDAENDPEFDHKFDERWREIIHNKEADLDRLL